MTSTLRPSSINLSETHWQRFVTYCRQKNINVFQVCSQQFCRYIVTLFDENAAPSTMVSHRTSLLYYTLREYDPASNTSQHEDAIARDQVGKTDSAKHHASVEPLFGVVVTFTTSVCYGGGNSPTDS